MSDINRYNLVDEPWIPIVGSTPVSLRQLFTERGLELAGNPIQRIALLKLLLAIAQAAWTPEDDEAWRLLGIDGMAKHCLDYLDQWRHKFWLYGSEPFLQMPAIKKAAKKTFGEVMPEIATGNTTRFTQSHVEKALADDQLAVLIVTLMGFALGGKNVDTISLSLGHTKKKSGKAGTHLGHKGYLHHFLKGRDFQESLWFNLLTLDSIKKIGYRNNIGIPPWEKMPEGEICPRAKSLMNSFMGRLVPLSRFCLLSDDSRLHYSDGIEHPSHGEGGRDPSVAVNYCSKKPSAICADPSKRPWRWLSSMLGFLSTISDNLNTQECYQLSQGLKRAREFRELRGESSLPIGIWSAGLKTSSNAGEQYVSGTDDFVESTIELQLDWLGENWFVQLTSQMKRLEELSKKLNQSVQGYCKEQKADGKKQANKACSLYWQCCESEFRALLEACAKGPEALETLWRKYVEHARAAFDTVCPRETARQLDAWSKYRSNINQFNNKNTKKNHGNSKQK